MITHGQTIPRPPARVVLLGGGGFIGNAIQRRLLEHGIPVVAPRSAELNLAGADAAKAIGEILELTDVVVMLAAITPDKGRDIAATMRNVTMMQRVCEALEQSGCAHFVYFSSDAVYDPATYQVKEDTPASPRDLYGAMHLTRELMAKTLEAIPLLVIRPTIVYGQADTHNSYGPNRFRRTVECERKIILFGDGEELRDHIHVNDVAELTVRCLFQGSVGVLNIATGVSHTFREVAALFAKYSHAPIDIMATQRTNPITHRRYDISNLHRAFPGFNFNSLESGVAEMQALPGGDGK